ncbi:hypothetical protein T484DRAFT_2140999 [Baffinella frigidus]|nr:hypothetical protein T484DRAFT_2140999 [Cryptophyta sp. CCMP2293]
MPPRRSEALAPLLTLASLLALDACSTDGQAGLGAAGSSSAQFPGGHHLVPNAAGRPRWVDGCEEMRFGDHTVSIQQMNARTGGPRSHRPWWLDEEAGRGAVDGTGGVVWGSARVLCEHLDAHPQVVRGKSVFELGSGTGVAALLCCSMDVAVVIFGGARPGLVRARPGATHTLVTHSGLRREFVNNSNATRPRTLR